MRLQIAGMALVGVASFTLAACNNQSEDAPTDQPVQQVEVEFDFDTKTKTVTAPPQLTSQMPTGTRRSTLTPTKLPTATRVAPRTTR